MYCGIVISIGSLNSGYLSLNSLEIQEPEEFYIISDNDDLVLTSKDAVELLLEELELVEYDEELTNFYLKLHNETDDRTIE